MLEETKLSSSFSFGFELEGICNSDDSSLQPENITLLKAKENLYHLLNKELNLGKGEIRTPTSQKQASITSDNKIIWKDKSIKGDWSIQKNIIYYGSVPIGFISDSGIIFNEDVYKKYKNFPKDLIINRSEIKSDSSIKMDTDDKNAFTFEYASPIIAVSPTNFQKMINFLLNLKEHGIYTNDSCGFHVHISYNDITKEDVKWILFSIANDEELMNIVSHLDSKDSEIEFFNAKYSDIKELQELKTNDINNLDKTLSTEDKYKIIRIHPQGTIEWRGPRNFIGKGDNPNLIKAFVVQLYKFIQKIAMILDSNDYNGFNRNDVVKKIKITGNFSSGQEYMSNSKLENLHSKFISQPMIITTMSSDWLMDLLKKDTRLLDWVDSIYAKKIWNIIPTHKKEIIVNLSNPDSFIKFMGRAVVKIGEYVDEKTSELIIEKIIESAFGFNHYKIVNFLTYNNISIRELIKNKKGFNIEMIKNKNITYSGYKELINNGFKEEIKTFSNIPNKIKYLMK